MSLRPAGSHALYRAGERLVCYDLLNPLESIMSERPDRAIGANVGDQLDILDIPALPYRFMISHPGDWEIGVKADPNGKQQIYLKRTREPLVYDSLCGLGLGAGYFSINLAQRSRRSKCSVIGNRNTSSVIEYGRCAVFSLRAVLKNLVWM